MSRFKKILFSLSISLGILYIVLLIPDSANTVINKSDGAPYLWNNEAALINLEKKFNDANKIEPKLLDSIITSYKIKLESQYEELKKIPFHVTDPDFFQPEDIFNIAALIAAEQKNTNWLIDYYNKVRLLINQRSTYYNLNEQKTKQRLYQLLYGMRAAIEEVLLQKNSMAFNPLTYVSNELSSTPYAEIEGIKVRSGDIFVSRGGAEVSALISRGNDFPGNFSHVALLYIDSTHTPYFIESHIEKGVAVSSAEQYLKDKKLRFMVLRPRAWLVWRMNDPMIPHKAAKYLYNKALSEHIRYDFKMNINDTTAMFCSEVASCAYKRYNIQLWKWQSTISSTGVVNWLNTFGVENFSTQMPSDLEYDPQLVVVAEWRDPQTLFKDHIDNAVIDVMLEDANKGEKIEHNFWILPFARILKAYSIVLNFFGKEGIIPEGMSATQALKNNSLVSSHASLKKKTEKLIQNFISEKGYTPPYWELVKLAKEAKLNN